MDAADGPQPPALHIEHAHPTRRVDPDALERLVRHVIDQEGGTLRALSLVLADHATVLDLNRSYLEHDYHTDVLAFPLGDEESIVDGEIYVDLDTAAERHAEFDATFEEEVQRYVVHGLLHLLGYDDATPDGKAAMHRREDRYLTGGA
ncbi:MAG: rRNA maturation RNase YbeY [Bacteroidetes bacterium]|jgi:rRNA maturation RNase YbeY|nr:rRNA maturation RNase YbeY [Bacteroidota bacterium]